MFDPAIDVAPVAHTMVSWLGTYFVHSTVLIGGVWMFTRFLPLDGLTRSLLWKMSLVGGLFTATLQTGLGVEPLFGTVDVEAGTAPDAPPAPPAPPAPETVPAPPPPAMFVAAQPMMPVVHACIGCEPSVSQVVIVDDDGVTTVISSSSPVWGEHTVIWAEAAPTVTIPVAPLAPVAPEPMIPMVTQPPLMASAAPTDSGPASILAGLFLLGAAVSMGRLGATASRLRRGLRGRVHVRGPLRERLARLMAAVRVPQTSVQLTMSERIGSPIALAGREIVVPERAHELAPRQQDAMLAHELAHVLRRDPAWQVLASVIEALLFFQPLNRVARRGMQEAAEELCDDWAVRHTGSGVHLARCLTEVASWPGHSDMSDVASPMAGRRSLLVRRVERLLDDPSRERGRWARRWRGVLGLAFLAMVGFGAPGLSLSVARAETTTPPAPPEPPEPPAAPGEPPPPLAPEPVFALARLPDATMPMAIGSWDPHVAVVTQPMTARQRRLLRRAERLERKAERLRGKGGLLVVPVVAPTPPMPPAPPMPPMPPGSLDDDDDHHPHPAVLHIDHEQLRHLELAAAALAGRAPELEARAAEIEARAEALAAEIEAKVADIDLEGLEDALADLDLDHVAEEVERELNKLDLDGLGKKVEREIEEAMRKAGLDRKTIEAAQSEARRELQDAIRDAKRDKDAALRDARREAEHARKAAQSTRDEAQRALQRALGDKVPVRQQSAADAAKAKRQEAARARAAEVQREVERAMQDGTIDAAEQRRIEAAARRAAQSK